ncbi:MAG: ABC transporter [Alphaproteobacteria bacterium]
MASASLRKSGVFILLVAALAILLFWAARDRRVQPAGPVALFTTLPILWADSPDLAASLSPRAQSHWARDLLAERGAIEPLDLLTDDSLRGTRRLLMAQPRVLTPQENVELDNWVREGGRLLLLADPALTEDSAFPLGDPRRPQAIVLLSPILSRWGLELRFDDRQSLGRHARDVMGVAIPVNLPGQLVTRGQDNCRLWGEGLAATCAVGKGRIVVVADAAALERDDPSGQGRKALSWLLDAAFAAR